MIKNVQVVELPTQSSYITKLGTCEVKLGWGEYDANQKMSRDSGVGSRKSCSESRSQKVR